MGDTPPDPAAPVVILIAASYGAIEALTRILHALPPTLPAAVAVVQHRPPERISALAEVLQRVSALPVSTAAAGGSILPGHVYLASPDRQLIVTTSRQFGSVDGRRIHDVPSSANPLFETAAEVFGPRAVGVVLTGLDSDGTDDVQVIHAHGGIVVAQGHVLDAEAIAPLLVRLASATRANDDDLQSSRDGTMAPGG